MPYKIYGGLRFYERAEIKNAMSYLRVLFGREDDAAFERVINIPKRGIGKSTLAKINNISRLNNISLFEGSQMFINENKTKVNIEIENFIKNIINWRKIKKNFDHIESTKVV